MGSTRPPGVPIYALVAYKSKIITTGGLNAPVHAKTSVFNRNDGNLLSSAELNKTMDMTPDQDGVLEQ